MNTELGATSTSRWTWSGITSNSIISALLSRATSKKISLSYTSTPSFGTGRRYFGYQTTWYVFARIHDIVVGLKLAPHKTVSAKFFCKHRNRHYLCFEHLGVARWPCQNGRRAAPPFSCYQETINNAAQAASSSASRPLPWQ